MKNIEALIDDGGEITRGAIGGIKCAASAGDGHNCLAMLVRREGETLNALSRRLDKTIATVLDGDDPVDEINVEGSLQFVSRWGGWSLTMLHGAHKSLNSSSTPTTISAPSPIVSTAVSTWRLWSVGC